MGLRQAVIDSLENRLKRVYIEVPNDEGGTVQEIMRGVKARGHSVSMPHLQEIMHELVARKLVKSRPLQGKHSKAQLYTKAKVAGRKAAIHPDIIRDAVRGAIDPPAAPQEIPMPEPKAPDVQLPDRIKIDFSKVLLCHTALEANVRAMENHMGEVRKSVSEFETALLQIIEQYDEEHTEVEDLYALGQLMERLAARRQKPED